MGQFRQAQRGLLILSARTIHEAEVFQLGIPSPGALRVFKDLGVAKRSCSIDLIGNTFNPVLVQTANRDWR